MVRSGIKVQSAWMAAFVIFGCGGGGDGAVDPDAIPRAPAELRFDDLEATASSETASWLASGSPRLIVASGVGVSCANPIGSPPGSGEIRLSVRLPSDARSGDIFELPTDAPTGEGAGAGLSIMDNVTFSFRQGLIVVDERSEDRVSVRIDVVSSDGTKSARGQISGPFCLD